MHIYKSHRKCVVYVMPSRMSNYVSGSIMLHVHSLVDDHTFHWDNHPMNKCNSYSGPHKNPSTFHKLGYQPLLSRDRTLGRRNQTTVQERIHWLGH